MDESADKITDAPIAAVLPARACVFVATRLFIRELYSVNVQSTPEQMPREAAFSIMRTVRVPSNGRSRSSLNEPAAAAHFGAWLKLDSVNPIKTAQTRETAPSRSPHERHLAAGNLITTFGCIIESAFELAGYGDPNVMASEPGASLVLNAVNGTSGRWSVLWTSEAALSITLVVGTFFLVINLLLFAAIYRRNRCRDRSGSPADKQVTSLARCMSNELGPIDPAAAA